MSWPPISRRRFLYAAGVLSTASLAGREAGAPGEFRPPVAVFGKIFQELKLDYEASATLTAEAGLAGVDCAVRPGGEVLPERATEDLPKYAGALRPHGGKVLLLTTAITGTDSPSAEAILRAARKLGVRYYRLGYWYHRPGEDAARLRGEIRARLKDLAAMNREIGVCGIFQNHSAERSDTAPAGADLGELYDLVKDLDPREMGVAFDLGHALITHGEGWPAHFERLKGHLRVAYVKDVRRPSTFVRFGEGEFGGTDFFRRLRGIGYDSPLSMHIEFDWAAAKTGKTREALLAVLKQSRERLERWLREA